MSSSAPLRSAAFPPLRDRPTHIGDLSWVQVVALSCVVVDRYPTALGWVVALQFAPTIVLGPWFGAVTDRHDRKRIVMLAEAGLGFVAAGYAGALVTGTLTLPLVGVLATVWGVLNALDTPARRALVPALVNRDGTASASAITGMVLLLGMSTGSALGAVLVATAGPVTAFAANVASFIVDVILLTTIRIGPSPRVDRAPGQLRDGLGYIWRARRLRVPLIALATLSTFAFTVQVSIPIHMRASFGGGPSLVGAGFTAVTTGGLVGAAVAALRGAPGPHSLRRASSAMAAAMLLSLLAPTVPIALAGLAGVGFAWSLFVGSTVAILQTAEPSMLGPGDVVACRRPHRRRGCGWTSRRPDCRVGRTSITVHHRAVAQTKFKVEEGNRSSVDGPGHLLLAPLYRWLRVATETDLFPDEA